MSWIPMFVCINTSQDCFVLVGIVKFSVLLPCLMLQVFVEAIVALTFMADFTATQRRDRCVHSLLSLSVVLRGRDSIWGFAEVEMASLRDLSRHRTSPRCQWRAFTVWACSFSLHSNGFMSQENLLCKNSERSCCHFSDISHPNSVRSVTPVDLILKH